MARRDYDEQIDPFNASDPVMPADDTTSSHDDSECDFDGSAYEAPKTKKSRLTENFKRQISPVDNVDTDEEDELSNSDEGQDEEDYGSEWDEDASDEETRSITSKKPSKLTFKFFAIVIIIFSLALSLIGLVTSLIGGVFSKLDSSSSPEYSYSELVDELQERGYHVDEWSETDDDEYSEDAEAEAYLTLVVDDRLSALKNDENLRQMIIDDFNYKFADAYGFMPEEAGLDSSAYADKVLNSYTYEINSVYAFLDEDEGHAYAYINVYQFWDFNEAFDSLAQPYLSNNYLMYPTDPSFTAEQKAQLQDYFDEAMSAAWELDEDYVGFDFTLEGDTWSIDEDAYQEEIEYAFSIYYNSTYYNGDEANIGDADALGDAADLDTESESI